MINELLRNKWFLGMLLLLTVTFAAAVFASGIRGQESNMPVDQKASANREQTEVPETAADIEPGYFFVQERDGAVNVYWYEGSEKQLYRETGIEFSMLSTEDQKLLKTGIKLEDEQELANFLENFDS